MNVHRASCRKRTQDGENNNKNSNFFRWWVSGSGTVPLAPISERLSLAPPPSSLILAIIYRCPAKSDHRLHFHLFNELISFTPHPHPVVITWPTEAGTTWPATQLFHLFFLILCSTISHCSLVYCKSRHCLPLQYNT